MTRSLAGLVALALALAAVVLGAPAAQAHNVLQSTDPAAGSTVPVVPELVSLTFNEPVLFVGTTIMVHTADDTMVNIGPPILVDNTVSQAVTGELPAGEYTVIYRVTSADGHPIEDEFTFTAAESTSYGVTTPPATEPASPSPTEVTPTATEPPTSSSVAGALARARPHRVPRLGARAPRGRCRARGDRCRRRLAAAAAPPDGTADGPADGPADGRRAGRRDAVTPTVAGRRRDRRHVGPVVAATYAGPMTAPVTSAGRAGAGGPGVDARRPPSPWRVLALVLAAVAAALLGRRVLGCRAPGAAPRSRSGRALGAARRRRRSASSPGR